MNRVVKLLTLGVMVSLLAALAVVPAAAQDECCQGGIIIEGNFGNDVASMNPALATDTASRTIVNLISVGFVGVDPQAAAIAPSQLGAIVDTWDVSEDGTVYTFHLRDDLFWSDGVPITATDVLYRWEVLQAGAAGLITAYGSSAIDPSGETGILDVTAPDDYTVVVQFASAECTALGTSGSLAPVPAHVLPEDVSTIMDADYNMNPTVSGGPFMFSEFRPGELISLVGNPNYADALNGVVNPTGFIYKNVPDQTVLVEQFLAGELNIVSGPPQARVADIRATDAQVYDYAGNSFDYLALNLADPDNPQPAFDPDGNPIDQGFHPIFGDVRVRQAISLGVDVDALVQAALFGEGTRMASYAIPSSWAYAQDLPLIAYDPEAAAALLDEAGWIDEDGDGVREAHGALHAEDGTPFTFTLYTNEGNTRRTAIGTLVQDQLSELGIQVDFQTIDFNTLLDIMRGQTFDSIILGWQMGFPDDPDQTQLFAPSSDVLGSGSNFTSYNNPEFTRLNIAGNNVPGCAAEDRLPYYIQMQEIFQQDLPYIPLFVQNGVYAAGANVEGFDPLPSQMKWNIDTWSVSTP